MDITENVRVIMREIRETVRSQTVVGAPIRSGETVIVPVSRVSFGFGVFGGAGFRSNRSEAAGTGAGVTVEPVAFLVIGKRRHRLLTVRGREAARSRFLETVPSVLRLVLKIVMSRRKRRRTRTMESRARTHAG